MYRFTIVFYKGNDMCVHQVMQIAAKNEAILTKSCKCQQQNEAYSQTHVKHNTKIQCAAGEKKNIFGRRRRFFFIFGRRWRKKFFRV